MTDELHRAALIRLAETEIERDDLRRALNASEERERWVWDRVRRLEGNASEDMAWWRNGAGWRVVYCDPAVWGGDYCLATPPLWNTTLPVVDADGSAFASASAAIAAVEAYGRGEISLIRDDTSEPPRTIARRITEADDER